LAQTIGSANVVTIRDGVLKGYNTDGIGFVQALLDKTGMDLDQTTFLILGAGGASRAICSTLAFQGARDIYILDKFDEASSSLVQSVNGQIRECAHYVPFEDAPMGTLIGQADVLVNATGIGMYPKVEHTPIDKGLLREELFVVDITYNPVRTRLLLDAEEKGCRTMNGVEMAINQGTRGFHLMTGLPEPVEIMREVMHRIVASR
jgi:shikimate dehydrogenase